MFRSFFYFWIEPLPWGPAVAGWVDLFKMVLWSLIAITFNWSEENNDSAVQSELKKEEM